MIQHPEYTIPLRNSKTKQELSEQRLTLTLGESTHSCSQIEGVVWALASGSANVNDIIYQVNSLELKTSFSQQEIHQALIKLADMRMLNLHCHEPIDSPIDISSYSHIASTRGGLYLINKNGFQRLAYGMFFGLCFDNNKNLLAFDFPHLSSTLWKKSFQDAKKIPPRESVFRRFNINNSLVINSEIAYRELANNIHQIHYHNDKRSIYAVNTDEQSISLVDQQGEQTQIPVFNQNDYYHINAINKFGDKWLIMKSVSSRSNSKSGFGVFDENWNLLYETGLPANRAHDVIVDHDIDDIAFWYCDSGNRNIKHHPSGNTIKIGTRSDQSKTVRGLANDEQGGCWVTSIGKFGRYHSFAQDPSLLAEVQFVDKKTGALVSKVELPETPCVILENPWYQAA